MSTPTESVDALASHPYRHPRVDELDKAEFIKQTAVMNALTHGATIGRLCDWRCAAEAFMEHLRANGFEVTAARGVEGS